MIIIIGAGISGLILAYELAKQNKKYLLIDKSKRAGGYIKTTMANGYQLELGPNSLLADNELIAYLNELGLASEIQYSNEVSNARFIFKKGKYRKLPANPLGILFGNFFSFKTKLAIVKELFKPREDVPNETLAQFFNRRFSTEIVQYALDPFISGIYAGDVEKLSLQATFPSLKKMEAEFGSVLKGLIKNNKGLARRKSINFKSGMQAFSKALFNKILDDNIKLECEIKSIFRHNENWMVKTNEKSIEFEASKIVFCAPSFKLRELFHSDLPIDKIANIRYAPMAVVHTVYLKSEVKHGLNGFGGLNPSIENQFSLGSVWTSSVFTGRCKDNEVLFTTFVGGDKQKHKLIENEPWQIKLKVHQELCKNFKIESEEPVFQHIYQWEKALPQYENSIFEAWDQVEELEKENILICANWKDGVSLSDCIKKAKQLAQTL